MNGSDFLVGVTAGVFLTILAYFAGRAWADFIADWTDAHEQNSDK